MGLVKRSAARARMGKERQNGKRDILIDGQQFAHRLHVIADVVDDNRHLPAADLRGGVIQAARRLCLWRCASPPSRNPPPVLSKMRRFDARRLFTIPQDNGGNGGNGKDDQRVRTVVSRLGFFLFRQPSVARTPGNQRPYLCGHHLISSFLKYQCRLIDYPFPRSVVLESPFLFFIGMRPGL